MVGASVDLALPTFYWFWSCGGWGHVWTGLTSWGGGGRPPGPATWPLTAPGLAPIPLWSDIWGWPVAEVSRPGLGMPAVVSAAKADFDPFWSDPPSALWSGQFLDTTQAEPAEPRHLNPGTAHCSLVGYMVAAGSTMLWHSGLKVRTWILILMIRITKYFCYICLSVYQNTRIIWSSFLSNFRLNTPNFRLFGLAETEPSYRVYASPVCFCQ